MASCKLLLLFLCIHVTQCRSNQELNGMLKEISRRLDKQDKVIEKQTQQLSNQNELISRLSKRIDDGETVISELRQQILEQKQHFEQQISSLKTNQHNKYRKYEFSSYGCLSDVLTMSCPNNRTLLLTTGVYGQYADSCASCCVPGGSDCTELISENRPSDWAYLKLLCDNQTSCSYEYFGSLINQCEEGYIADYMEICYDCYPLEVNDTIGFTAYATTYEQYELDDVVQFDGIVTNIGSHYDSSSSIFSCPYPGVYMFSVNIVAVAGYHMYVDIMQENETLVEAYADEINIGVDSVYQHGSAFVIIECNDGQEVWTRTAWSSGYMFGHATARQSIFTGYLLYRYE